MKVEIMHFAEKEDGSVGAIAEYSADDPWFVRFLSDDLTLEVEYNNGEFRIRATNAGISIIPEGDNTIRLIRRSD